MARDLAHWITGIPGGQRFDGVLQHYHAHHGQRCTARFLHSSVVLLEWLQRVGRGQVSLSAFDHCLGPHMAMERMVKCHPPLPLAAALAQCPLIDHGTLTLETSHQLVRRMTLRTLMDVET